MPFFDPSRDDGIPFFIPLSLTKDSSMSNPMVYSSALTNMGPLNILDRSWFVSIDESDTRATTTRNVANRRTETEGMMLVNLSCIVPLISSGLFLCEMIVVLLTI